MFNYSFITFLLENITCALFGRHIFWCSFEKRVLSITQLFNCAYMETKAKNNVLRQATWALHYVFTDLCCKLRPMLIVRKTTITIEQFKLFFNPSRCFPRSVSLRTWKATLYKYSQNLKNYNQERSHLKVVGPFHLSF